MPAGFDPHAVLQRVLLLERQQGFQDRSAVGGLSAFILKQVERAAESDRACLASAAELLAGYSQIDRRQREAAVAAALQVILTRATPNEKRLAPSADSPNGQTTPVSSSARRETSSHPRLTMVHNAEDLDAPLGTVRGIRKNVVEAFARLGVSTVRDLLYFFPRTHYDYTETRSISRMRLGQRGTLVGTIKDVRNNRTRRGTVLTTATIADDTGTVAVRWFNQPYLLQKLPIGARIAITGEPDVFNGYFTFSPRDFELIEDLDVMDSTHTGRLVPVYPLTKGLFQRSLRQLMRRILDEFVDALEEFLPAYLMTQVSLPHLTDAVRQYHFPEDETRKADAERRLAFDELLLVQLGLLRRKRQWQQHSPDLCLTVSGDLLHRFRASLPFQLTGAQERVIREISDDLDRPFPMSRLLQGDVGSGKTVVAAAALLQAVRAGRQGVLMAPTEILAEQHYRTLRSLMEPFALRIELLIGSTPRSRRRQVYTMAAAGEVDVVVGTHALIQEGLEFARLGLAITDEQHRFGVEQRAALRQKGLRPHTLAMTATPIPRTLAMTIYGDLDVSALDEMPPGRLSVITTWSRTPAEAYGVVRDEIQRGKQAFVICPVIEESMDSDMRSVIAEHKELQGLTFPDLKVGLLHGRMKPAEKESTLDAFRSGSFHILVATSVVEVGIDVPNATVMVIRDAHRFGLAQLHQFRGRVGRGGDQAYCVLLSPTEGDTARERLEALTATDSGFELAEQDLRLRGPGEFWGTRQSGLPELKVATLGDLPTIELARRTAVGVLSRDPELSNSEHSLLLRAVERFWTATADLS